MIPFVKKKLLKDGCSSSNAFAASSGVGLNMKGPNIALIYFGNIGKYQRSQRISKRERPSSNFLTPGDTLFTIPSLFAL